MGVIKCRRITNGVDNQETPWKPVSWVNYLQILHHRLTKAMNLWYRLPFTCIFIDDCSGGVVKSTKSGTDKSRRNQSPLKNPLGKEGHWL